MAAKTEYDEHPDIRIREQKATMTIVTSRMPITAMPDHDAPRGIPLREEPPSTIICLYRRWACKRPFGQQRANSSRSTIIGSIDDDGYLRRETERHRAMILAFSQGIYRRTVGRDKQAFASTLIQTSTLPAFVCARPERMPAAAAQTKRTPTKIRLDRHPRYSTDYFDEFTKKHYDKDPDARSTCQTKTCAKPSARSLQAQPQAGRQLQPDEQQARAM